jgi:hypothetical protein
MPLSSVAVERTFGVMRTLEDHTRMAMGTEGFKSTLLAAGNKWLVEKRMAELRAKLTA